MKRGVGSLLWLTMGCSTLLFAQERPDQGKDTVYVLSPVIVTAMRARERETPVTFTNLTPRELRERYSVQDVPVLLAELPSITTYSENGNGIGYNYINIRGFDQRRISVMINGVPQNDPEDHNVYWIDFPDLLASTDDIQVQRGAGSAFYGPPAIGGSVNLVTNPFQHDPGITLEGMIGFQQFGDSSKSFPLSTRKMGVSFSSGLVGQRYMVYGRLARIQSDGYRANSYVDMGSFFFGAIRLDGTMTTRFHFFGGPIEDGLAYYGLPKFVNTDRKLRRQNLADWGTDPAGAEYSYVIPRRPQETESFSQPHAELIHEWRVSNSVTLHNTLFYYVGEGYFDYDASWADTSMLRIGSQFGIPAGQNPTNTLVRAYVGNRQWGWLPRVEVDHGGGALTVGAELRLHRSTHWGKISFAGGLPPDYDPDYHFYEYNGIRSIISVFGHEVYHLRDDLNLMADLQIAWNSYGIRNEKFLGHSFTVPYFFANPRAGLNYNLSDLWSCYLSLGYTSREPRMRNLYAAEDSWFGATPQFSADTTGGSVRYDFGNPLAKPEHLLNLELGARYAGPVVQAAAIGYWMEFTDELVKSGQVDIFGQPVTGNAGRTRHFGVELDGAVALTDAFSVSGNITVSRNRLVSYHLYSSGGGTVTLDGNPVAGFPGILGNLRLAYRQETLSASLLVQYVGAFQTDNFNSAANATDAYALLNAEVMTTLPRCFGMEMTLRAGVRNILNTLYLASGEGNSFFPGAERNVLLGMTVHL
jgi:iron complex outermembrane receptor protein